MRRLAPSRLHHLILPLAALGAVLPMLLPEPWGGASCGHDFDFHLLSWLEAARQLAHGVYPVWAGTPAWNAGEPRFLFYPPLSWLLGALLGLVLPWAFVPGTFTFLTLMLAGFTAQRLARQVAPPAAATLAATVYLLNPYMLFTAYERSAYGELLAAAVLPLLVSAALASRVRVLPVAGAMALVWLANAPAGVMASYALALLMLVRLVRPQSSPSPQRRHQLALRASAGAALGLALAGFYLVPAVAERPLIQADMALVGGMGIEDNFLFHHTVPATPDTLAHDFVLRTVSFIAVSLLAATLLAFVVARRRTEHRTLLLPLGVLSLAILFALLPWSAPLWRHVPELRFLQFPWRLLALLAVALAVALAAALSRVRLAPLPLAAVSLTVAALLILPAWRVDRQPCDPEDTAEARVALFRSTAGTEATDEYTPAGADGDALRPHDPPYWLVQSAGGEEANAAAAPDAAPGPAPDRLALSLPAPATLVLNRRAYPAWEVHVNGQPARLHQPMRDDGLIAVDLPAGPVLVELEPHRTPDRTAGLLLSGLAAAAAIALARGDRRAIA